MTQLVVDPILSECARLHLGNGGLETNVLHLAQGLEDLRLAKRIAGALRATGYRELCGVEVSVNTGAVYLAGRVPSYHLKQLAQASAMAAHGVCHVHNGLEVISPK